MRITVTARHCAIPDGLRARARAVMERLGRIAARPHDGRVVFTADHGAPAVEVQLHTARGRLHVARAQARDHRTALDRAAARVRRQLDKRSLAARRATARRAP